MRRHPLPLLVLLLAAAAGCASVRLPDREGVELYIRKCSGCHRPYAPGERTAAAWQQKLPEMAKRAKLTPEELLVIRKYLDVELVSSHWSDGATRRSAS